MSRKGVVILWLVSACAAPRGVVMGLVTRSSGPAVDCVVQLTAADTGAKPLEARTDAQGRFRFEHLPRGHYRLEARAKPGEQLAPIKAEQAIVEVRSSGARADLRLIRDEEGGEIRGITVDQFGRPLSDVSVCGCGTCADSRFGVFSLGWIAAGPCGVSARADWRLRGAYEHASANATSGQSNVRLVLAYLGTITGRVLDENRVPISDFRVGEDQYQAGSFDLSANHAPGTLEIAAEGYATEVVAVGPPDAFGDIALPLTTLTRGDAVRGRVLDATGAPVEGAIVQLPASVHRIRYPHRTGCGNCDDARRERELPNATTGADGRFVFPLSATQTKLVVTRDGYLDASADVKRGEELVVKLGRGGVIRGRVLDLEGKGIGAALVYVTGDWRLNAETRSDGSFELAGLETRGYRLAVESLKHRYALRDSNFQARVEVQVGAVRTIELRPSVGSAVVVLEQRSGRAYRLVVGDALLPPANERLLELLDDGIRCSAFGSCDFPGLTLGRYTLVRWHWAGGKFVVEAQPLEVRGPRVEVKWSPVTSRSYSFASSDAALPEEFRLGEVD